MAKSKSDVSTMTPSEQILFLKKSLGYQVFDAPPKKWLDTGSKRFNAVLGSGEKGLAYGKTYTLAGKPSSGKSLIAAMIMGLAQADGAKPMCVDVEHSVDCHWWRTQGIDTGEIYADGTCEKVAIIRPELGVFGRKKKAGAVVRMQAAEELFDLAEKWIIMQRKIGVEKVCVLVDSTTAVEPMEELVAGLDGQNMRTKMLAPFLNLLTKRWNKLAFNTNAIIIYISQLRKNPAQMFGNPEYIPGGAGVLYYPSSVNIVKRVKGGLMFDAAGHPVSVASVIKNTKNKVGGKSVEGSKCAFHASFNKFDWHFMSQKALETKLKGASEE